MAKMIHSMIRVLHETRSVAFYRSAFGLEIAARLAFDGFTLIYLSNGESGFELELTVNNDRKEPYALGDGYGHIAVSVEHLAAEHARLTELGHEPGPMRRLALPSSGIAEFFFVQDPDGYK